MLDIYKAQHYLLKPASQLATQMVRLEGGDLYKTVIVQWNPPPINNENNQKSDELVKTVVGTINSYKELLDTVYEGDKEYKMYNPYILRQIIKSVCDDETLLEKIERIYKDGIAQGKADVAAETIEKSGGEEEGSEDEFPEGEEE